MRILHRGLSEAAAFAAAGWIGVACVPPMEQGPYRCGPSQAHACPAGFVCCSDDPAAIDLGAIDDLGVLPGYLGRGGTGVPVFSGDQNALGDSGLCIKQGAVPIAGALSEPAALGCPVPCNPTWTNVDIEAVCGSNTICCQTLELEAKDCVLDPDSGCWRAVTGLDIVGLGGDALTEWGSSSHATHQDPDGCQAFVAGVSKTELDANGISVGQLEAACLRSLSVADQRGFCLGQSPTVTACPLTDPAYRDACEQKNDAGGLTGCD